MNKNLIPLVLGTSLLITSGTVLADKTECKNLPSYGDLTEALKLSVPESAGGTLPLIKVGTDKNGPISKGNGGLEVPMWATLVDKFGHVCAVTYSGENNRAQWPASRIISMQKAYTANSLTISGFPGIWSTALLFTPTQPGQFLWGLDQSNPVDPAVVYQGPTEKWGAPNDPAVGKIPGGNNRFGGGVAIWKNGEVVGAIGVSGDTSCADHNIALRVRDNLVAAAGLSDNPAGKYADNIIYDIKAGKSASGLGHPTCPGGWEDEINYLYTGATKANHDDWPK
jgi:uncharacterized protein GlcG (DUF336 family)